jgi:DNA-binding transcriptional LysR family regulator
MTFVGFHRDLAIRRHIDRFLRKHGVKVEVECEFDTIENIKHAIIDGQTGVALLPEPTLRNEIRAGTLAALPLEGATLTRPLGVIYRRHHELSNSTQKFLDLLLQGANGKAAGPPSLQGHASNGAPAGTRIGSRTRQRRS